MSLAELRASLAVAKGKLARANGRLAYRRRKHNWYHQRSRRRDRDKLAAHWHKREQTAQREVDELTALVRRRQRQIEAKAPNKRRKVVNKAARYVGVRETVPNGGGIITTWQRRFRFGNVAWCGLFAGNMLLQAGVRGVTGRIAGVALIEQDAQRGRGPFRGWSWGSRNALPGDLACIGARGQHVEIVVARNSDGSILTIGGNVSDSVMRMRRPAHQVRGIAHIRA